MKISKTELSSKYGINLPAGNYQITSDGMQYKISTVQDSTDGCILVGTQQGSKTDSFIGDSKTAYNALFRKITYAIKAGEKVSIQIM